MRPVEMKPDVFWVGAVDWSSRDFHGYSRSPRGTTYNAYLIKDEKTTLFDTVKHEHAGELLCSISHLVNPEDIDYVVVNHLEPDHAGSLPEIIERCKPEKVFVSPMGERALKAHFHDQDWPVEVVKSGDSINIGKRDVHFVETRMLHWPDSMCSYVAQDKLLITNDIFGQNIASKCPLRRRGGPGDSVRYGQGILRQHRAALFAHDHQGPGRAGRDEYRHRYDRSGPRPYLPRRRGREVHHGPLPYVRRAKAGQKSRGCLRLHVAQHGKNWPAPSPAA